MGEINRLLARTAWNDPSLKHLNLYGRGVDCAHVQDIADALRSNTFVTSIDFDFNDLTADAAEPIVEILTNHSTLLEVDLDRN